MPRDSPPSAAVGRDSAAAGSGAMFDRIARRYDLLNRVLSLGVDQRWRRAAVAALALDGAGRALDLATGTGDLALRIARRHPSVHVMGLDPSGEMISVGRTKIQAVGLDDHITLALGDAQDLPFADGSFDAVSIAFGIRNVPARARALAEMARVTRADGRVVVLELSEPSGGFVGPLARFHLHNVVPRVGALFSGASEYRYLQRSVAAFPRPEAFAELMSGAGLRVLEVRPLTFGVCVLFVAQPGGAS